MVLTHKGAGCDVYVAAEWKEQLRASIVHAINAFHCRSILDIFHIIKVIELFVGRKAQFGTQCAARVLTCIYLNIGQSYRDLLRIIGIACVAILCRYAEYAFVLEEVSRQMRSFCEGEFAVLHYEVGLRIEIGYAFFAELDQRAFLLGRSYLGPVVAGFVIGQFESHGLVGCGVIGIDVEVDLLGLLVYLHCLSGHAVD